MGCFFCLAFYFFSDLKSQLSIRRTPAKSSYVFLLSHTLVFSSGTRLLLVFFSAGMISFFFKALLFASAKMVLLFNIFKSSLRTNKKNHVMKEVSSRWIFPRIFLYIFNRKKLVQKLLFSILFCYFIIQLITI